MDFSIGGKVFDVFDDLGLRVLAESGYLEKVASLSIGDPEKILKLEDDKFGVVFLTKKSEFIRKYPIHDYPHTALSNVYFQVTHDRLPPEARVAAATNIKHACSLFGLKGLPAIEKYAGDPPKPGAKYVRIDKVATQITEPVRLFEEMNESYEANRHRYSREEKIKLAKAMEPVASKFGFEIPKDLQLFLIKDAEVDELALFAQCAVRKNLLKDQPEAGPLMDELLEKRATVQPESTVSLLEMFDRQFGLDKYWERGLEPRTVLMEKEARHSIPIRGVSMEFSDKEVGAFTTRNDDLIQKMFGRKMADLLQGNPKAIWQLPKASREFLAARMEQERENAIVKAR